MVALMNTFIIISWLGILFGVSNILSQNIDCDEAFSCSNQYLYKDSYDCNGFGSCYNAAMNRSSMTYINCYGAYSCYTANISTAYVQQIWCFGLYSCGSISNGNFWFQHALCYGELSCAGSTLSMYEFSVSMDCYGSRSCMNSRVPDIELLFVNIFGHMGGAYTSFERGFEDTGFPFLEIDFQAAFSGRGAVITESATSYSHDTSIVCWGNSCNDLILGPNVTASIDCSDAEKSVICPNGYTLDTMTELGYYGDYSSTLTPYLYDILASTMSSHYNSFTICNDSKTIGNYQQYKEQSISNES